MSDVNTWLRASDADFERMLGEHRALSAKLMTRSQLQTLLRLSSATVRKLPIAPRQGGGHGIKVKYHVDDVRSYLAALNPQIAPETLLPTTGGFLTPNEVEGFLAVGGSSISNIALPAIRVTGNTVRYREQDLAACLVALDDGSELAQLIHSEWIEERLPPSAALMEPG